MNIHSLHLSKSIIIAVSMLLMLLLGLGLLSLDATNSVFKSVRLVGKDALPSIEHAQHINIAMADLRGSVTRSLLATQQSDIDTTAKALAADTTSLKHQAGDLEALLRSVEEKRLFADFEAALTNYLASNEKVATLVAQRDHDGAAALILGNNRNTYLKLEETVQKLIGYQHEFADKTISGAERTNTHNFYVTLAFLGFAALLGLAVLYFVVIGLSRPISRITSVMGKLAEDELETYIPYTRNQNEIGGMARALEVFKDHSLRVRKMTGETAERSRISAEFQSDFHELIKTASVGNFSVRIHKRYDQTDMDASAEGINRLLESVQEGISETCRVMEALANGDMTETMNGNFQGAFGDMQDNMNAALENLRNIIGNVREAVDTISGNADEMRHSATSLSTRTEQQAASLEETSAAVAQISNAVDDSTRRAHEASEMVDQARRNTKQSGDVVQEAISAMSRIEQASNEIGQILNVIDEIAFQTNLLALNAGVEAARAGEAGKGFAVVAQEVRELAQRSAEAGREIKTLISRSTSEVESGVKFVTAAGEALQKIQVHVAQINEQVYSIATGANEQSTSLRDVNSAIGQMDQMTQQNAAMVEETAAVSARLNDQALILSKLIAQFKTTARKSASSVSRNQSRQGNLTAPTAGSKRAA